jgi:sec-independent protein translocase protein TatA
MSMPGGMEWLVILAVVVLLFGAKKIPALAEGLGKGIKNFKNAMKNDEVAQNNQVEQQKTTTHSTQETKSV